MKLIKRLFNLKRYFLVFVIYRENGELFNLVCSLETNGVFPSYYLMKKSMLIRTNETVEIRGFAEVSKKDLKEFSIHEHSAINQSAIINQQTK